MDNGSPGQRGCDNFFRSTDKGLTWIKTGELDAATIFKGDFGWPRREKDHYILSGFDRFELYQCPFTERIYISMWGGSGVSNYDSLSADQQKKARRPVANTIIAYSDDMCKTWNIVSRFEGNPVPLYMTSTPNGRFCALFSWGNSVNVIFNSLKDPNIYYEPQEITNSKKENLGEDTLAHMMDKWWVPQISISRVSQFTGESNVRVSYPALNEFGRQYFIIKDLALSDIPGLVGPNKEITYAPQVEIRSVNTIESPDKKNKSLIDGTFIDPDYIDIQQDIKTSVFYWIESSCDEIGYINIIGKNGLAKKLGKIINTHREFSAKYCIYYGEDKFTKQDFLSKNGGKPYTWSGNNSQGDYYSGGFFWGQHLNIKNGNSTSTKDTLNFLCQWVEPDGIHGNIITAQPIPKKKFIQNPKDKNLTNLYVEIFDGFYTQDQVFTSSTDRYTTKVTTYGTSTFGFNVGYRISDWIGFETGFQKLTSGQDMEVSQTLTTFTNDKVNPMDIISIPLRYTPRFNIGQKINIYPSIGIKLLF